MTTTIELGVFDSGVGGIAVLREIRALVPEANVRYVADTKYVPYGSKEPALIRERSTAITRYLVEHGAEAIVVACNTATTHAVDNLRLIFPHRPIVGMEPAIKPAALATRSRVVGILATGATLTGARVAHLIERNAEGIEVITQPCPGLVEQVEAGDLDGPGTVELLQRYIEPLLARGADALVIGCTHYTLLQPAIQQVAGPDVALFDGAAAVARRVASVVGARALPGISNASGRLTFLTTGRADLVRPVVARLWSEGAPDVGHAAV